jgi:hypothetical protein
MCWRLLVTTNLLLWNNNNNNNNNTIIIITTTTNTAAAEADSSVSLIPMAAYERDPEPLPSTSRPLDLMSLRSISCNVVILPFSPVYKVDGFQRVFPTKILYSFLVSPFLSTCPAHHIF